MLNESSGIVNVVCAIVAALGAVAAVVFSLDRGIFFGSTTTSETGSYTASGETYNYTTVHKTCRYLYVTGIAEFPALGGDFLLPGQSSDHPERLHCRLFKESN